MPSVHWTERKKEILRLPSLAARMKERSPVLKGRAPPHRRRGRARMGLKTTLPAAAKYPPKQSTEARDVHVLVVVHGTSQTISFVSSPYSSNSLKQSQFFRCGSVSARGLLYLGVFYQAGITCALTVAPNNALTDALNVQ
eukprot:scaffold99625_cov16-Tisochrysis_lutea.AAC.1